MSQRFLIFRAAPVTRALGLCLLSWGLHGVAAAQAVHKCQVGGKTIYQSTPCANDSGQTVSIMAGPSDEDAQAARARAQREQAQASTIDRQRQMEQARSQMPAQQPLPVKGEVDRCKRLSQQRDDAYARRNNARNAARRGDGVTGGSPEDQRIGNLNLQISGLEMTMRSSGCSFTP